MTEGHYTAISGLPSGWNVPSGIFFGYTGLSCSAGFKRNGRRKHPDVLTSQHSSKITEKFYVWCRQWDQGDGSELNET